MTQSPEPTPQDPVNPSRRDRLRPLELLVFATVLGVFAGLIVLLTTRDWVLGLIFLGIGFIVSVLMVALVGLGGKPSAEDEAARKDLQQPDNGKNWH
ncbi:ABC transporter ATP-binding protein [Leucobacter chromiireducens]|uniref:ABC transporter ATP-binding protein n=1 Tax=Leucobacter chromiireducens subsp. solipictus TaxID=398235 RepID=A0ABS1SIU4_9MICO|nr:ABC transporter ATP-binding protein [Leucobacter chromiireducens]MBL3680440.1 ABC transporter ATP-binding protein [Leucobacter chromiireducens subsp. solipictus]